MIQPTKGKVVIERDPADEKVGSLYIPDTARDNANIGTVVAVNREVWWEHGQGHHPEVKVGDRVLVGKYSGVEITYDEKPLLVLAQKEILAILPPANAPLGIHVKEDAGVHS